MVDPSDDYRRKILVVEDEPAILAGIKDNLELEDYEVLTATDGQEGLKLALESDPDLILLDVMMPKLSGFDVLRKLRENRIRGSVILLTAKKAEEDKVRGLKLGADDYVSKPFSVVELLARVQAVLRRTDPPKDPLKNVRFHDVRIDFQKMEAFKGERALTLTPREFKILRLFVENPGKVVSRNELLDKVWGYDVFPTTRTVDNHIVKLRKQVEDVPSEPKIITSVRGVGYKFNAEVRIDDEEGGAS
ncbi:MAG: DNA-binding response regulator [Planctomycetota bacterium]|nr:MAG: DNA-binding response regulator [Planctomycetota bacterium]